MLLSKSGSLNTYTHIIYYIIGKGSISSDGTINQLRLRQINCRNWLAYDSDLTEVHADK